jgi:hypothetical protein
MLWWIVYDNPLDLAKYHTGAWKSHALSQRTVEVYFIRMNTISIISAALMS